ncbi:MAG: malic enzyme-like NAD(P)-binding protein [Myxococcota bacterium]
MNDSTNWYERYNASSIMTVRVRVDDHPGTLAKVLSKLAEHSAQLGNIKLVGADGKDKIRDIQVFFADADQRDQSLASLSKMDGAEVIQVIDEVLEIHRGGTIQTRAKVPLNTLMDLRMVYTPGVAHVCQAIVDDPVKALEYTAVGNKVAIVTDGTAVLGLGDIGPLAGMPVMEGKAAILDRFAGISAEPILINSKDPHKIVDVVSHIADGYGAIQLEDIAAPSCFIVERALQDKLSKPVFHDDQHGTATVCVAGLLSALHRTNKKVEDVEAVVLGAGAAGAAIARFLVKMGVADVVVCDGAGALYRGRDHRMNDEKRALVEMTNRQNAQGTIAEAMKGKHLFVGVSRPNLVSPDMVRSMAKDPIVFALANPVSEISVSAALQAGAAVAMDGRGMNNALAYPGIFRGALDARATRITHGMMLAAATALAEASSDSLLPDMLDMSVHRRVAEAVQNAWAPDGTP